MKVPSEQKAIEAILQRLAELLLVDRTEVRRNQYTPYSDSLVEAGPFTFLVKWNGRGSAGPVAATIEQALVHVKDIDGDVVPAVAVPFMGEAGRRLCTEAKVAWLDLSGNARILAPGLNIQIEGQPNRYKRRGRPSSVFAPKSSRIARCLLMHPLETWTQRNLSRSAEIDEGYTSKIVGKLENDGLIVRDGTGAVRLRDPDLLLDAWSESYSFSKHHLIRGHVAARSGDTLLRQLAETLKKASVSYAATGLASAWLLDHFAGFRIATLYLEQEPSPALLASLSFREDARGANVWLVIPNDMGVFHGATLRDGIRCVHPVQTYLDLHAHPERAQEASTMLRTEHLIWRDND